ncbi:MAG TPA: tetratricopeptide repeat protein [Candidatus Polarisedimenticolaceae bacterium]|nr:tetratricopeptide repeat protein [Candidatus Polarisedimenticolaceae bacterium]
MTSKKKCNVGVPADDPGGLPVIGQGPLAGVRKSRRGRWRAAVLISVHAVIALHVTHFLVAGRTLSPVEPSESMYTLELGYVNCGFVFFGIALLATLVFGRFFCGWGCHIVALQDLCAWLMRRLGVRPKPFRSRLLAYGPIVLAFYMFAWPTLWRLAAGGEFPGLTRHFTTTALWATFPGPVFATLTFAVCGFAAVYFLGAKGFCTYGCPYGGLFGALDYASPGRIVVSDACEQCGHCTATCTSNVRVHEEVRLHGMVVDPGCMKCMDCVSVCPKNALSFSFAAPALLKGVRSKKRTRTYDLSWPEEILAAAIGTAATLAFRGLYDGPPLLMAVGLGGITAFLSMKLLHLVRRREVRIQNLELKSAGKVRRPGWAVAAVGIAWVLFTGHSALAQWDRAWGRYELDRTEVSREEGLSGAFRARPLSDRHVHAADEAYRHFSRADRVGLSPVVEVKLGLAWSHVLRGELDEAARYAREAVAISPGNAELRKNQKDIETALHFEKAGALVESGDLEGAAREYGALVALAPDAPAARFNYGGVLRRLGRSDAAIEQLAAARDLVPNDQDVWVELGLSYAASGRRNEAIDALERAIALNPETPEARMHLPGVIEELKGVRP